MKAPGIGRSSALAEWTLDDWLAHTQAQHWRSIDMGLSRIAQVWKNLRGTRSAWVIAVAGTNGKGSCVAMLEAALLEIGRSVQAQAQYQVPAPAPAADPSAVTPPRRLTIGSYTSPYLLHYNERVRIDGVAADDAALCQAFADIERARDGIALTYFEFGTLCALRVFQRREVDVALLEVGMGGRLDAVNVVDNDIALLTSIGIDHAQWLGDSRDAIGAEKAGIMTPGAVAVCADPHPPPSVARVAVERQCELLLNGRDFCLDVDLGASRMADHAAAATTSPAPREAASFAAGHADDFRWRSGHRAIAASWRCVAGLAPPFGGARQRDNLAGVAATLALTARRAAPPAAHASRRAHGHINAHIDARPQHLIDGLAKMTLGGRCQVVDGAPQIILDVAHNPDAAAELAGFLARRQCADKADQAGQTRAVLGVLADKAAAEMMAALGGVIDHWYLATLLGERGQTAAALERQLRQAGDAAPASTHASPLAAYSRAMADAQASDRVVVWGSFQTVGAILAHLQRGDNAGVAIP